MKVVIIDYGMGNIKSIVSALKHIGITSIKISSNAHDIKGADKLILPGVGSFAMAMKNIKLLGLNQSLSIEINENKKPVLGICLGMQLMSQSSTEERLESGLGYIESNVIRFDDHHAKVPHVGFNQVTINKESKLFDSIDDYSDFYFVHSYFMKSNIDIAQSYCEYGQKFIASFEVDNIAGVQFHPELSQTNGLRLLKNFIEKF